MNENSLEDGNIPSPEQAVVEKESVVEQSQDTLPETIAQIKEIDTAKDIPLDADFGMAKIGERVNADQSEIEMADEVVHFQERSKVLNEKRQETKKSFDERVCKALLPIATAFAMNWGTVLAQESPQTVSTPEIPVATVQAEKRELSSDSFFDKDSPLAQSSEMKKKIDRPITVEELGTLEILRAKAWEAKNEWFVLSGRDKAGKYVTDVKESGSIGGFLETEIDEDATDTTISHTHPVEVSGNPKLIRERKSNAFIMPPSSVDIGQCMDDATSGRVQRVVDPRGVWEYRCDENSAFIQSRKKAGEDFLRAIESIQAKYNVDRTDYKNALTSLRDTPPAFIMIKAFGALEAKYPGIEKSGQESFTELVNRNKDLGLSVVEYELEGTSIYYDSPKLSDEENAKKISTFIKNAEKKGIYMSYTPFKESPKPDSGGR